MTSVPRTFRGLDALVQKEFVIQIFKEQKFQDVLLEFQLNYRDVCHLFRVFSKLRYAFAVLKYEKPALRQISSKIATADIFFRNKLARGISWEKNNVGNNQGFTMQHYIFMKRYLSIFSLIRFSIFTAHTGSWRGVEPGPFASNRHTQ